MEQVNQKHTKLLIGFVFAVTAVVFAWIYRERIMTLVGNIGPVAPQQEEKRTLELGLQGCDFGDDAGARRAAMEKMNPELCACIREKEAAEGCRVEALGVVKFNQIVKQLDASRCRELEDPEKRQLCERFIASGIEQLSAEDPLLLAGVYIDNNNYAMASAVLTTAVQKDDAKKAEYLTALALNYANQGLAEHREAELVPKALDLVGQALAINPNSPEAYRVKGFIFEVKPDYEAAVESYSKALEIDGNYVAAYVGRGHAYNLNGDIGKALADLKKAKEMDSDRKYPPIYSQLCRLELIGPDVDQAIEDCSLNVELAGGNEKAEAHGMLAGLYLRAGQTDQAETQVGMALAVAPQNPIIRITAALVFLAQGKSAEALKQAEEAVRLDKTRALAHLELARASFSQGKTEEAIVSGEKALSLVEKDVSILPPNKASVMQECYAFLAEAYGRKGDLVNEAKYRELGNSLVVNNQE